jgi:hypothetical protein
MDDKIANPDELWEHIKYDNEIQEKLGPGSRMEDFKDDDIEMPTYDLYTQMMRMMMLNTHA